MKAAVVGNSPILLKQNYGDIIDQHDCVIRFNLAKTENFEKFVGSKTTVRFCNQHPVMSNLSEKNYKEQKETFPDFDRNAMLGWKNQLIIFKYCKNYLEGTDLEKLLLKNNNKIDFIEKNDSNLNMLAQLTKTEPTMGLLGTVWAISRFRDVNCFGFGFGSSEDESYHYFEKHIPYKSCHNSNIEKNIFEILESEGKINIYK